MFEEKYKGKTVGEINQAIETLSKALSTASDPREREQIQAEIDYLNTFDRSAPISSWEATKKEDTAEGILANSPTSQEIIDNAPNSLTKKTVEEKGNRGDNKVAMKYDPSYWNAKSTAEVVEEQKNNVDKTPPEELVDKTKSQNLLASQVPETPKPETPKPETKTEPEKKEGRYKSSMYGILDAMRNGDIDKSTGLYFMLDALSKAARNTGIDIGNIGAQFSGGNIRDDYQDSLWNQRRDKMFSNEMSSELNQQSGTDKELEYSLGKEDLIGKGLSNEQADLALNASRTFNDKAEQFRANGNEALADLYTLVASASTREVGPEELAAIAASGVLGTEEGKAAAKEITEMLTNLGGAIGNTFGGINDILSFIKGNK